MNKLSAEEKVRVVACLVEGNSLRPTVRMTGVHRDTIMRLAVRIGEGCKGIMDAKMRNLNGDHLEVDEIWGFIGAKQKNAARRRNFFSVKSFVVKLRAGLGIPC